MRLGIHELIATAVLIETTVKQSDICQVFENRKIRKPFIILSKLLASICVRDLSLNDSAYLQTYQPTYLHNMSSSSQSTVSFVTKKILYGSFFYFSRLLYDCECTLCARIHINSGPKSISNDSFKMMAMNLSSGLEK